MAYEPEARARELMLNPADKAAYLALMDGDRANYKLRCPGCQRWIETYESDVLTHVRTCEALRAACSE